MGTERSGEWWDLLPLFPLSRPNPDTCSTQNRCTVRNFPNKVLISTYIFFRSLRQKQMKESVSMSQIQPADDGKAKSKGDTHI